MTIIKTKMAKALCRTIDISTWYAVVHVSGEVIAVYDHRRQAESMLGEDMQIVPVKLCPVKGTPHERD